MINSNNVQDEPPQLMGGNVPGGVIVSAAAGEGGGRGRGKRGPSKRGEGVAGV